MVNWRIHYDIHRTYTRALLHFWDISRHERFYIQLL